MLELGTKEFRFIFAIWS